MPICKYYQKGICRFGDNCRYIHVGNPSQNSNRNTAQKPQNAPTAAPTTKTVIDDLSILPQWKITTYAPAKYCPCVIENTDISPEEDRIKFYLARIKNTVPQYVQEREGIVQQMNQYVNQIIAQPTIAVNKFMEWQRGGDSDGGGSAMTAVSGAVPASVGFGSSPPAFNTSTGGASTWGSSPFAAMSALNQQGATAFQSATLPLTGSTEGGTIFGSASSSSAAPTFGQSSFPQATNNPVFGQPSFGQPHAPSSSLPFGQASTGIASTQSPFGQSPFSQHQQQQQQQQQQSALPFVSAFGGATATAPPQSGNSTLASEQRGIGTHSFGSAFGIGGGSSSGFGMPQQPPPAAVNEQDLKPHRDPTAEERQTFSAAGFEPGKVPEVAPPLELR
ncbi:hypothetical protein EV182_000541 [Spiromyces aspiralis]|uniref:Uncharacterized protein n=1 Tax=Spiromyces aspiralis TaxID=68401 RepID=A0ACC1HH51_9FUNG|nr:hypothetical protein EV182_000541 [Spiromyces aspiralis]